MPGLTNNCRTITMSIDEVTQAYSVKFAVASYGTLPTTSIAQMVTQPITFDVGCQDYILSPYQESEII
jgi:hypothetical protein